MIVNLDLKKHEDLQKVKNDYSNYIVLDAKGFQYKDDEVKFRNAIEVMDLINTIHWANEFYKNVNSEIRISTKMHHRCIDASFTNKAFTNDELTEYCNTAILIEDFFGAMLKFKELDNYLPYALEFVLFGLSYDNQNELSEKQKEHLHETYGDLYCDLRRKNIEVKTFIEKIKTLIQNLKKTITKDEKISA